MTGRRARAPYNPSAAHAWRAATVALFLLGFAFLAVALGLLLVDWRISGRVALAGLGGLVSGVLCTVASALWTHAIDGPPGRAWNGYPDDEDDDLDGDEPADPLWGETP